MAAALGMTTGQFSAMYVQMKPDGNGLVLRGSKRGCVFLSWEETSGKATCAICPSRPKACRDWVASLSRPECQEGLAKLEPSGTVMTPDQLYSSRKPVETLSMAVLGQCV